MKIKILEVELKMSYCSKCGTKVENENFCYNCGAKIEKEGDTPVTSTSEVTPDTPQVSASPQSSLAPSELVLLRAEEFAKKGRMSNITIMNTNVTVNPDQLGKAILRAAIIANINAGTVRLEQQQSKASFGLRKVTTLHMLPGNASAAWPDHSIEGQLCSQVLTNRGNSEVYSIVYKWLEQDSFHPWEKVVENVQEGLSKRGLLGKTEEKKMGIFTSNTYQLPQSTASMPDRSSVESVKEMLNEYSNQNRDKWSLLEKQLDKAIYERTD